MGDIISGFELLFSFQNMFLLVAGVTIGFVVGALPGFNASNAMAIVLPLTIAMNMESALIFMAAIYAGAQFSGAVPAILINAPGTTGAAATTLDGYPMTLQGKGGLAIGIARMSSVIGGLIGCVVVVLIINPMSTIALSFGSPELFLVALFGLTLISMIVGGSKVKAFLSAALGLLIASMAADPSLGQPRFTMGYIELYEGVRFVPILIGLFALTEMFLMAKKNRLFDEKMEMPSSGYKEIIEGIKMPLKKPILIARTGIIGTIIGVIPGAGTSVATFINYGIAKRFSKRRENFGKGEPEGVMASEATDSAVISGTMVPTLTLGIPGSTTAAIMLAAVYLHGVTPGPQVMSNYTAEVFAVILSIGVASLLILPIGVVLAQPLVKMTQVTPKILVPMVLFLAVLGGFAVSNSMFDVRMMFIFGLIGVLMRISGVPIIPLVLGLILGPIAEENFVRAYTLSQGDFTYFFDSGISIFLWGIIFISILSSPFIKVMKRIFRQ